MPHITQVAVDLVDGDPWSAVEAANEAFMAYFDEAHRPAGIIYPVSRIPNLDGIVEVSAVLARVITTEART
jgi:enamine deaminase RidA (YjgF/YER057c/UK114 family)